MTDSQEPRDRRTGAQKIVSLKEDGYYSNCTMVEATPFDIAILFGKIRPKTDEKGQPSLVELYEKQIYLSHMQARGLFEALGKSLEALARAATAQGGTTPQSGATESQSPSQSAAPAAASRPATAPRSGGQAGGGQPGPTKP